jgi:anti-sigma regulatory factor (Ser/Thr protein kinase)
VRLPLTAAPESVGAGRRFVQATLRDWGQEALADTAQLLVSELVTNAVLHAKTGPTVVVRLGGDVIRIEVLDGSSRLPRAKGYGVESSTGRGLLLVDRMAASWGTEIRPGGGKVVWFELALESGGRDHVDAGAMVAFDDLEALAALGGWEDPPAETASDRPRARVPAPAHR